MVKFLLALAFVAEVIIWTSATREHHGQRHLKKTPRKTILCRKNEIWSSCPEAVCAPKTCKDVGFPVPCPDLGPDDRCPSKPGCICREGFVRDCDGICVPEEFCPSCGGDPNAVRGCGTNCNRLCSNYDQDDVVCTQECLYNACDCKKGYVFDEVIRKCVKPSHCTPPKQCKKHEIYDTCPAPCPFRTCGINDAAISCVPALECGHPDCPPPVCRCKDGFYRNHKGNCVRWENCPNCKRPNEVYDPCPAPCPQRTCDVNEALILCEVPPQLGDPRCKPACRCKDGFVRNKKGICIPKNQCPPPQCPSNEEFSDCIEGECKPENCFQLGFPLACPKINATSCTKGCICEAEYARDDDGNCIPIDDCPSCGDDPNAVAGCGLYCNQRCRDVGKDPYVCIDVCYSDSCDCRPGYYLDDNTGKCVLPKHCTPQCPFNEVFSNCIQGNCNPKNCSQVGQPVACPRINPKYCKKGCVCREGYARDEDGYCIPIDECPTCGGDPNKVPGCGVYCNQRCRDIGKESVSCIEICYNNACDCEEGYYLDDNTGFCVLPEECTPQCPENEFYSECIQGNCSPKNCSQVGFPVPCPRINPKYCKKGCLCKEGYARNDEGVCIPSNQCVSCGGDPNAQPGCGGNCNKHCSDIGKEPGACTLMCDLNGCDCKKEYYYDDETKQCVKPEQCPSQCPANEVYSDCIQGNCKPGNCSQVGFPLACPKIDPSHCKKGCICAEGYARDDDGYCVPIRECPSCGGDPNKIVGCGVYCNQRCRDIGGEPQGCIAICYENSCDCQQGYYLNDNTGFCVLPEECTPQCPENEFYSECTQGNCSPKNCADVGFQTGCPKIDPKYCKKGCLCKEGYARNKKGICIPTNQCPSCRGDPNAQAGCGGNCNRHCSDIGQEPKACLLICEINGCDCKDGYYYDDKTEQCVLPEQCSASTPSCGRNEEFSNCSNANNCGAQICEQLGYPVSCDEVPPENCMAGCRCKPGFVRDTKGVCIPSDQCPSCGGDPNAKPGCGGNCNKHCSNIGKKPGVCILSCRLNGCDCKDGYYFDDNTKRCVRPKDCSLKCSTNEVFSNCINGGCQPRNCSLYGKPVPCVKMDPKYCIKGCVCKENYLRTSNGQCVPAENCPEACNGINEEYNDCSFDCLRQTCENLDRVKVCPIAEGGNCKPMCRCKPGYFRNKIGQCITEEQCRRCMGPHEFYSCGGACDNVCKTLDQQSQDNCPIVNIKCNEMCYCEKGYARARNNTCIPISFCDDDFPTCRKNEVFEDCQNPICKPKFCTDVGFPLNCNSNCKEGCICKDEYVRDEIGRCIPIENCPSCGGDPNAVTGCGVNCGRRCSNLGQKSVACPAICNINGCDCRKGYFYDDNIKKCVKPEECQPQCKANERYETCPGSDCQPQYCSQIGFDIPCSDDDSKESCPKKPACVCIDGFVKDENGRCIPKNECPSCGGDVNSRSGCGVNCGKRCRDLGKRVSPCLRICYPNACDCIDGYYYDTNQKKCVLPQQCTDICDKNEVFEDCSNPTCKAKSCSELGFPLNRNETCQKGCICQNGYVRDSDGICIPTNQCPSCGGDPNAHLGCGTNCGRRCPNNYINPRFCPRIACIPELNKCDCNDGFFYDINTQKCVKPKDCSPRCNKENNEVYDSCVNGGCGWRNCSQVGGPQLCIDTITCLQGCKCRDGYYRLEDGTCVPENECPTRRCNKENNEVYDPCVNGGCGWRNCSQVGGPQLCIDTITCLQGCKCRDGYYRLEDGTCVPKNECPSVAIATTTCEPTSTTENAIAKFKRGNQALAGKCLYLLLESRPGENFMISGFSIIVAMAQLALNAVGETYEQLMLFLNLDSKDEIRAVFPELIENYKSQQEVTFELAVKYYSDTKYPFSKQFTNEAKEIFNSSLQSIDFGQGELAADTINDWVEDNTNGLIKHLVDASMFSKDTRCVLVNALYFLGNWQKQFNEDNTQVRDFYINPDNTASIDTMYQKGKFEYAESNYLNCQILKLPYKGGNFSLVILLPKERFGLNNVVEKLKEPDALADSIDDMRTETVEVYLPTMNVDTDISDLTKLLQKLGLTELFNPNANGFEGILEFDEPLFISDAIQKTKIKVNEKGTEAAAATGIIVGVTSVQMPKKSYIVDCNQPFVFILKLGDIPMFCGVFSGSKS